MSVLVLLAATGNYKAIKADMQDCWPFTCCLSRTLGSLLKCSNLSIFCRYYFGRCSSELAQLVLLPYSLGSLLTILIDYMIFLSPFLDVTRMSMSTVSFFTQLDSGADL